jgi:hypothetical protein
MTGTIAFAPLIDLPLLALLLCAFLFHFNGWARTSIPDSSLDLAKRLPAACFSLITLFTCVLIVGYSANIAIWSMLIAGWICATAIAFFVAPTGALSIGFFAGAWLVREWSFGFPHFVLAPPTSESVALKTDTSHSPFVGALARTVSPLRPRGEVEINGDVYTAYSEDGTLVDENSPVTIVGHRDGALCARLVK